jgi:putative ABC transport system permease protein
MKAQDVVDLASRNLRESVLRNSLTTVGIAVGVASLVAMLSLGIGLQQLANRRLARSGLFNTVIVSSREMGEFGGPRRRQATQEQKPLTPLDDNAREQIAKIPHVLEVYPDLRFMAEVTASGGKPQFTQVSSLPQSAKEREAFENLHGKFFSTPDAAEAILQNEFAQTLSDKPDSLIGKELTIRYAERAGTAKTGAAGESGGGNTVDELVASGFSVTRKTKTLKIVAITEHDPEAGLRVGRAAIFVPLQTAEGLNVMLGSDLREMVRSSYRGRVYMTLTARVDDPAQVQAIEDQVKKLNFSAFSLLDVARSLQRFFRILDLFLGIFGSLALAVALLGIVNTLIMAILERRREIGIMKAVGAADSDISGLFLAEAGAMGLMGGVIGVLIGWAIGQVINGGTNIYLRSQQMPAETLWSVPWWLVAGSIILSVLVSLVSGWYPASRAAKLDPVQALRYE